MLMFIKKEVFTNFLIKNLFDKRYYELEISDNIIKFFFIFIQVM